MSNFLNKEVFSSHVISKIQQGADVIDSIVSTADKFQVEMEDVKKFLTKPVMENLEASSRSRNLIKGD